MQNAQCVVLVRIGILHPAFDRFMSLDVLIVGAGPAGLAAAIAATKAGPDLPDHRKGRARQLAPALSDRDGVLHHAGADGDRRAAVRQPERQADAASRRCATTGAPPTPSSSTSCSTRPCRDPSQRAPRTAGRSRSRRSTRTAAGVTCAGRTVVLATGAYDFANTIGVPGEDLPHVSHYFTAPHPFYRKRVVIVGGKNSAAEAALELYRAGAHVTIVHRRAALGESIKYWVKPDIENRIKEGSVAARFNTHVVEITPTAVVVERTGGRDEIPADGVFLLTGYISDTALLRAAGVELDPETCGPRHNPETFETNVPGSLRDRRDGGRQGERQDLHRERALPRPGGHRADQGVVRDVERRPEPEQA